MTCTARWATGNTAHRAGDMCGQPATERVGDSDLCPYHFGRALDWFYKRKIELPEQRQREHEESLQRAAEARRLAAEARSIVYYLHRPADGLIKIGTSTDYKARFSVLRAEHGELRLLLACAGGRAEEAEAHRRFAAARAEGEWFRPELPLLLEILRIRRARGYQQGRLPEQVPLAGIRALIKAAREQGAVLTATLTATAAMDSNGQECPLLPNCASDQRSVQSWPPLPTTTDQKAGGSSPSERATLTSGNTGRGDLLTGCGRLNDRNRDSNREAL